MEEKLDPEKGQVVATGSKSITMPIADARKFYRQCIELMQPILKLRKREADVLAELLYFNYMKRDIANPTDRATLVFGTGTRKLIQERLKISNPVIQQALGGLRRKKMVSGINIRPFLMIEPNEGVFSLTFNFVVE